LSLNFYPSEFERKIKISGLLYQHLFKKLNALAEVFCKKIALHRKAEGFL